jgi:hypothetical protein
MEQFWLWQLACCQWLSNMPGLKTTQITFEIISFEIYFLFKFTIYHSTFKVTQTQKNNIIIGVN